MNEHDEIREQQFEMFRPLLFAIAYRMLGTVNDAEDMVQETYLRYQTVEPGQIRSHKTFLTTVITRLSIDHLKSARQQREAYVGAWLPEPLLTDTTDEPAALAALNESLSMAFLVLLERLNPLERAVFLLRDVFDYDYPTIAGIVGKSEPACRQAVHRAREAIRSEKLRFHSTPTEHRLIFEQFLEACLRGDLSGLEALLAHDVVALSDGGGKASAATRSLSGPKRVAAFMLGLTRRAPPHAHMETVEMNGQMSVLVREHGVATVAITAAVEGGRITALWFMRNPDKLQRLGQGQG